MTAGGCEFAAERLLGLCLDDVTANLTAGVDDVEALESDRVPFGERFIDRLGTEQEI